jgi:hypothetical protein
MGETLGLAGAQKLQNPQSKFRQAGRQAGSLARSLARLLLGRGGLMRLQLNYHGQTVLLLLLYEVFIWRPQKTNPLLYFTQVARLLERRSKIASDACLFHYTVAVRLPVLGRPYAMRT